MDDIIRIMIELKNDGAKILPENIKLVDYKGADNIVVISPHPDDDVIGLGGTIKLHSVKGEKVFVIYMTSGSGTPAAGRRSKETIIRGRQEEAAQAMHTLGVSGGFFLNYESKEIIESKTDDVVQDIFSALLFLQPKLIYTPSPFEPHLTHLAATQRTLEAIRRMPGAEIKLRGYKVWGEIFAAREELETVDISETVDAKKRAIRAHESEIKFRPYDTAAVGKNHFDAIFNDPHGDSKTQYCETFLIMDEIATRPELELDVYARNLALKKLHDMYEELIAIGKEEEI